MEATTVTTAEVLEYQAKEIESLKAEVARLRRVFHNAVNAYPRQVIMPVPLAVWWIGLYKGMVGE